MFLFKCQVCKSHNYHHQNTVRGKMKHSL